MSRKTKFTARAPTTRVKTAKNRTNSSARWLQRQLNDPYVAEAQARGYRSRAAFKILELDGRFDLLRPGMRILELGAAPGGWTQVIAERLGGKSKFIALDLLEMPPISGAEILMLDFMAPDAPEIIRQALGGPADAVLSDMAAPATGHSGTDAIRVSALAEAAFEFALEVLAPGGVFAAKVLQGGIEAQLLARVRRAFARVRHAKPPASRADSPETYLIAQGFRGEGGA
ncbi:MAG: RlmE family RNA methyltransferase [Rhodospirillales bacterium]